ncbi:xanthine dehydrogenase family protein molybdopterin-binding subunit [Agilicoccus flavus]|uniref:xanthine dehydrogenase family protein molybdopterin-binding subunit n=1 Tax=Agilicoccus flavus TaxID=2775968 RepID=UPI001CF71687|nr:xanthine dehydrogenase family protein molybdopterin-binding subunit [Agilicoccus flavus]
MSEPTGPTLLDPVQMGRPVGRLDGRRKVLGVAPYAVEHEAEGAAQAAMVASTVPRGRVRSIDATAARALPGVLAVLDHTNAPRVADGEDREFAPLQDDTVWFRRQPVALVVAESSEVAREAAALVAVEYDEEPAEVGLRPDSPRLYTPEKLSDGSESDTSAGDVEAALAAATHVVDETYATPYEHNNPMEPHATIATWHGEDAGLGDGPVLTLVDSTQGVHAVRSSLAPVLGIEPERLEVVAPYVGGGFGSKGAPHVNVVLAALAAKALAPRPVRLTVTRQQMFALVGYRTATIQHFRLGADADGRLTAISHDVLEQSAAIKEFVEQTGSPTRSMYAAPNRRTTHRVARLDVAIPFWMRAPGEMPGMFAHEVAMDELAHRCGLDPIELRVRNEPDVDPETGHPFGRRRLLECLRRGAERFGWEEGPRAPLSRREGDWLVGTGVASSTYPANAMPGNEATVTFEHGCYAVGIGAADIGTGSWTSLTQVTADALGVGLEQIRLGIGDTRYPSASVAGGSSGLSSWGIAITAAARAFREQHGDRPSEGASATAGMPDNPDLQEYALNSYGAHFAKVRVHADTGQIRVPRMLGVFSVGRAVNPTTLRSQFLGGMVMGLSAALFEESVRDPRFGHVVTQDLASYHVAANADVADLDAIWLDDDVETHLNPMGSRGAGEIGIVGSPAAIVNAVFDATGVRVRDLPVTADKLLAGLLPQRERDHVLGDASA